MLNVLCDTTKDLVLLVLTSKYHLEQYSWRLFSWFCNPLWEVAIKTMSSAYIRQGISWSFKETRSDFGHDSISVKSLIYILNNKGLSMSPCLTPIFECIGDDSPLSVFTRSVILEYMFLIISWNFPLMPMFCNLWNSPVCQTLSNAFLKSIKHR